MTAARQCGDCQLCCKLLPMKHEADRESEAMQVKDLMVAHGLATHAEFDRMRPDFYKPAGQRCPHQKHHKGCTIYAERPFGCRFWNCRWLVDEAGDTLRPDHVGYVIDIMPDFITVEGKDVEVVVVWVDPARPDAHRDPRLRAYLEQHAKDGKLALIRLNERDSITLFAPSMSGDGQWHEVPGRATVKQSHERLDSFFSKERSAG